MPSQYQVLVVEDVPLLARVTVRMLELAPHRRYVATHKATLVDGLAAAKTGEYDVALLDLNLPDSANLATLTTFLAEAPELPVIVLTAESDPEAGLHAVKMGAQDFLLKGDFSFLMLDRAIRYSIERHRLQRILRQLAVLDDLTGLYNRRGFHTLRADLVNRVKATGQRGFLCYFDLDRFKQINDACGHPKGDAALAEFASNLRSIFPLDTLIARIGGDEFAAMGIEHESGQLDKMLDALRVVLAVRNRAAPPGFRLEYSAGIAFFEHDSTASIEELTAEADAALYRCKQRGRHASAAPAELAGSYP